MLLTFVSLYTELYIEELLYGYTSLYCCIILSMLRVYCFVCWQTLRWRGNPIVNFSLLTRWLWMIIVYWSNYPGSWRYLITHHPVLVASRAVWCFNDLCIFLWELILATRLGLILVSRIILLNLKVKCCIDIYKFYRHKVLWPWL